MLQTFIIFGASGDLTSRKLIPSLFQLHRKKRLPAGTRMVGFRAVPSRTTSGAPTWPRRRPTSWGPISKRPPGTNSPRTSITSLATWGKAADVAALGKFLDELEAGRSRPLRTEGRGRTADADAGTSSPHASITWRRRRNSTRRRLHNWARAAWPISRTASAANRDRKAVRHRPGNGPRVERRRASCLCRRTRSIASIITWARRRCRTSWCSASRTRFSSRFGIAIIIDHVQITAAEEVPVGRRGGYYESAGVLRDMFQNHLAAAADRHGDGSAGALRRRPGAQRKS